MALRTHVKVLQRREIRDTCEVRLGGHAYASTCSRWNPRAKGPAAHGPFGPVRGAGGTVERCGRRPQVVL